MRVTTPEINWHNRDPVYSVDFCFRDNTYILATCGTDCFVRLWSAELAHKTEGEKVKVPTPTKSKNLKDGEEAEEEEVKINHRSTLVRHTKAVNVVRFSSDGRILASAGDDAVICLWRREKDKPSMVREEEEFNEEWWKVFKSLRGHLDDVYDLSWSKNGQFIVSGSIDNSAIIWNAKSGDKLHILREHKGLVQGVAWDPRNSHVATLSTDRCLRLFNVDKKFKCAATIFKMARKVADDKATSGDKKVDEQDKENSSSSKKGSSNSSSIRLYQDDTMKSFFRRPTFSPDGQLLVTPAGLWNEEDSKPTNAAFIYNLRTKEPAVRLPLHDKAAIAVRFCPVLFALRPVAIPKKPKGETESQPNAVAAKKMIDLPYRMVLAVATEDAIIIYDTQQTLPLGIVAGVHYHQLSDLSWSTDGRLLVVASTDGYVSTVSFDEGELGAPYADAEAALKEVNSMVSIWKPKEEGASAPAPSSRKASSRASKTKAMEQNSKEISARMEAKAKLEKLEEETAEEKREEMEKSTASDEKVKTVESKPLPATVVKPRADDSKRRVQLTSLSSSSSGSSTFTSGSAPRRVGFMTLGANSSGADAKPDAVAAANQGAKLEAKSEGKPEQKRIQLLTLTSNSNVGEKSEVNKPRRVQLTSLVSKPKTDEEPMDT